MSDQRKKSRKNLMAFTPVYSLHPRTLLGYIEDLTAQGTMIIGEKPVEVDKQFTLVIEFHGVLIGLTDPSVTIPARAAWCRQEKGHRYFDIGFEFIEIKPGDEKIIEAVLKSYEFRREIPAAKVE